MMDADQVSASTTPRVAAREDQTPLACVESLHPTGIVAKVERDPALARLVRVRAVWRSAKNLLHFVHLHADLQPRKLAASHCIADHFA